MHLCRNILHGEFQPFCPEQFRRKCKCFAAAGQAVKSSQTVDCKSLAVGMLGGIRRFSVKGHRPVYTAVLPVQKAPQKIIGMLRAVFQILPSGQHRCCRKRPQDPAVQNAAFIRSRILPQVFSHIADESAVLRIPQSLPERKDNILKVSSDLLFYHKRLLQTRKDDWLTKLFLLILFYFTDLRCQYLVR